ncbi:hypothetical protein Cgig2_012774 [Carnegiea gigantea]|uniref:Uncharacterized protein n=1 Tax=Carnegiea gigantea TaxID=171969 RepID=A0A9Q1QFE0_9CARY|nr:hypothetical protein Cgig2_012774 [Carnegiea gigantea]
MKAKKLQQEQVAQENGKIKEQEKEKLELRKAVAQAWHSHLNKAKVATSEFDARKLNFQTKPSRFNLEAMNRLKANEEARRAKWEFYQSLWDSYEIVAVSKKLETGLILDYRFEDVKRIDEMNRKVRRGRESKNSLRNLFNMVSASSRRLSEGNLLDKLPQLLQ